MFAGRPPAPAPAADRDDEAAVARRAASALARVTGRDRHDVVVVLGSGWAPAAGALGDVVAELPVAGLPGFHAPVAQGHPGLVRSYDLAGVRVLCLLGRTHLFEGHGPAAVVHPVRVAAAAGCRVALLTNANGSLRDDWPIGTGMLITDHLDLSGATPLTGPRFVELTDCWSPRLRALARQADPDLHQGVYALLRGPSYETPAEARMLRTLGADVVGMSTVLEAVAAREAGLEVFGLSVVTALELGGAPVEGSAVVAAAEAAATRMGQVLRHVALRAGAGSPSEPPTSREPS
ncbi:MAG: purine-nucleoside phosphorylase [Kineosporiaceae bacterium]